jgi:hypothetical protein
METAAPLRHLVPDTSVWIAVPRTRAERARTAEALRRLPRGSTVVLSDPRLGSRRRSRALARQGAMHVDRELLAIPSVAAPMFAVEDVAPAVASFWRCFVTVPAGVSAPALPVTLAIRLVTVLRAWTFVGAVIPGRFTVGRRS